MPSLPSTIVALSSGVLPSGIAVVRASGPGCRLALKTLTGGVPEPRRAVLRTIRNADGGIIDRGLVLFFEGPASVTGEDLAEFHLHGGRAVVAACLDALIALPGHRLAKAGEFTRRAFENGRIDLTEAEGLADLLSAETEAQRQRAFAQSSGTLRRLYEGWMTRLVHARAMLDASFDFSDEGDVGDDAAMSVDASVRSVAEEMHRHLAMARGGEIVRDGFKVAIVGPPNVGKSTLLNRLADREAAIVSDTPGTTRDVVEVRLDLGGMPIRLFDTAGLRETDDRVEAIGVERAKATLNSADLVLLMIDSTNLGTDRTHVTPRVEGLPTVLPIGPRPAVLHVYSKADDAGKNLTSVPGSKAQPIWLSAHTGVGLAELTDTIIRTARVMAGDPSMAVPSRVRHREILSAAAALLDEAAVPELPFEVQAELLRHTTDELGVLTGRVGVEGLLDIIFSQFCIGK